MRMLKQLNDDIVTEAQRREFVQLAVSRAIGDSSPNRSAEVAARLGASPRVIDLARKAVAGSIDPTSPGWGSELGDYLVLQNSFIASLASAGCYDRILPDAISLPPRARILAVTLGASGSTVDESAAKPLTQVDINADLLDSLKVVGEVIVTNDLAVLAGPLGMAFLEQELRKAVAVETDLAFLAAITNGVTPGAAGATLLEDLATALASITSDANARFYALISPANLKAAATAATTDGRPLYPTLSASSGGILQGAQLLPCDGAGSDLVVLDATQLVMTPGSVAIKSSMQANSNLSGGTTASLSLWQNNMLAVRAERKAGAKPARSGAVAVIADIDYSA